MVKCSNCGAEVMEGKFCEKCGTPLEQGLPLPNQSKSSIFNKIGSPLSTSGTIDNEGGSSNKDVCPHCGYTQNGGKFCEKCGTPLSGTSRPTNQGQKSGGFFESISNSINSTASSMLAIKSDYNNNVILYKVKKIPNVKDKTIKIEDYELVFFNQGNGFAKIDKTFQTEANDFVCFYMKNITILNNNFVVKINSKIKKLDTDDSINVQVNYIMSLGVGDIDKFFDFFAGMKQDSWTETEVNSYMSSNLRSIIEKNTIEMLHLDGDIDLRNPKDQISKFIDTIKSLIQNDVEKYGLKVNNFNVSGVNIDVNEINKILINNLYKGE